MLVQTITFGMHNTNEIFSVPNTADNYEIIAGNRFTRQIKFVEKFSFQATKEMKAPAFFIETLALDFIAQIAAIEESEMYNYDEMVGSF